jgi:hypothetical protein
LERLGSLSFVHSGDAGGGSIRRLFASVSQRRLQFGDAIEGLLLAREGL